jgi:hypothetical protein
MKVGVEFESQTGANDTNNVKDQSNFNISLSETTDDGMTISTSFEIVDEGTVSADDDNAIKLTFTDGSALELLNAGNASATHVVSVPGAGGEQGIGGTSTNNAPTGVDFGAGSTALGIEWHSASDFLQTGLKMSASFSTDSGAAKTATARVENSFGVGATYVTKAGDTDVTIGLGVSGSEVAMTGTQVTNDQEGFHFGISAVTNDLTIGVGYGDGDSFEDEENGATAISQIDGNVMKAGISYAAADDLTLAIGIVQSTANDSTTVGTAGTTEDSHNATSASVTYTVATNVSAVIGYTDVSQNDEGEADSSSGGSAWYIGATMSF